MILPTLLGALVAACRRRAAAVVLAFLLLGAGSLWLAAARLSVSTDTNQMFDPGLPWRQAQVALATDFPQFADLIVAVIEAATPEEADATAAGLAQALAAQPTLFRAVRVPAADPWLARHGLLYLAPDDLTAALDRIIDAQPFLGQLAGDPSARGLFATLALMAVGIDRGEAAPESMRPALAGFDAALEDAAAGRPTPLSWQRLLGGKLVELAGPRRIVLAQAELDHHALEPGGRAIAALRAAAAGLDAVAAGRATVRVTGPVALAGEEFASVADGAALAVAITTALVLLCLILAVRSWRLILPIAATLVLGLFLTTGFAALAVGTLNLISFAFAVLFIGMAVDFGIQFAVRYREQRQALDDAEWALARTGAVVGPQMAFAALATAAGFLAFVPTGFRGVAELGLIAGTGMLIALACSLTFLPAAIALLRPRPEAREIGLAIGTAAERTLVVVRWPILAAFAIACAVGAALLPEVEFDTDPLHTKNPHTEAMATLAELIDDPLATPYTADIMAASPAEAAALSQRLAALPQVARVLSLASLVPGAQDEKLPLIADAASIMAATLAPRPPAAPVTPGELRMAVRTALAELERVQPRVPADHPLRGIATHLRTLAEAPDDTLLATNAALTRFLPAQLDRLRLALQAEPVTPDTIPETLARDWRTPDGRLRVQASAAPAARDPAGLQDFVAAVRGVTPNAGGSAVTIVESANTITGAFRTAVILALAAIALLLLAVLRNLLDAALVLGSLLASALLTVLVVVLLPLPLNFANIIALPLLLGVGVSYNIYFVMNWRAGERHFLGTATARAILLSAATTATSFGALAASAHPGTASMGALLLWSLAATLLVTLVLLPVLLAWPRAARRAPPALLALALLAAATPARAATLEPPAAPLQGGPAARATLRLDAPASGPATLSVEWTDALGRTAQRSRTEITLRDSTAIPVPLDMRRAVAMDNRLAVTLERPGQPAIRAEAGFTARPQAGWPDWVAIMWHPRTAAQYRALHAMGIAGGMAFAMRETYDPAEMRRRTAPLVASDTRWYVENIATDFYANYHRWRPDKPSVTWLWDETRRRHRENPADRTVWNREPSLSDPEWIARIQDRLRTTVRDQSPWRPLFYNLGDESAIADLAAAWDFDFSDLSLAAFRTWLRTQYRDLAALNRQWGTEFPSWDAIMPPTTNEAMARPDRNWSGWGDFKDFMDAEFARALRAGTDAAHQADRTALVGIAGSQKAGWGGYDYARLPLALDLMEIYSGNDNAVIALDMNPALVTLSTSFGTGPAETGRLWHEALRGQRGTILWDEDNRVVTAEGTPGPRGAALAPTLRELAGGIGAQLIAATPHHDEVAILYSPASFRTHWLIARLADGPAWVARDSEREGIDSGPPETARRRAAALLSALGVQPRFISPAQLGGGQLRRTRMRLLVLPEAIALSDAEAAEIRAFAARGGIVLALGPAGLYDGRSRLLPRPQLAGLAPARALATLPDSDAEALPALAALLARARLQPALRPTAPDGTPVPSVQTRIWRTGETWIWSAQRLGPAGRVTDNPRVTDSPNAPEGTTDLVLALPPGHVAYDMRRGGRIGTTPRLALRLSGTEPTVLAIAPARLPAPTLAAPATARLGEVAELRLGLAARGPAGPQILRIEVRDPTGAPAPAYSGNALLRPGRPTTWALPLAASDPPGLWHIRATDLLTGATDAATIAVAP
jgi:hopanoid biosynthesis associated RND transporter like protein HpnN